MHSAAAADEADDELDALDPSEPDYEFRRLSLQSRGTSIAREGGSIEPLRFYKEYVAINKPVIIENAVSHWPALTRWTDEYLKQVLGNHEVSVQWTPNGRADAILDNRLFVQPEERKMPFSAFLDAITPRRQTTDQRRTEGGDGVLYCSRQNSSFSDEFAPLWKDIDAGCLPWAAAAFGIAPDAVNMWIGTAASVSSMHKDPYENIYAVVAGEKHFTLLPPTDLHFLYERPYPSARYKSKPGSGFEVVEEGGAPVPWISVDPDAPDLDRFPLARHLKPYHAVVRAGDVLYLPSLWFHKVAQRGDKTISTSAVNWWYDMAIDVRYNYYTFMEHLSRRAHSQQAP